MQTRKVSLIESWTNVAIGWTINYLANLVILPAFGFKISLLQNFYIGCLYTFISVIRSYVIRRWFNAMEVTPKKKRISKAEAARQARQADYEANYKLFPVEGDEHGCYSNL